MAGIESVFEGSCSARAHKEVCGHVGPEDVCGGAGWAVGLGRRRRW